MCADREQVSWEECSGLRHAGRGNPERRHGSPDKKRHMDRQQVDNRRRTAQGVTPSIRLWLAVIRRRPHRRLCGVSETKRRNGGYIRAGIDWIGQSYIARCPYDRATDPFVSASDVLHWSADFSCNEANDKSDSINGIISSQWPTVKHTHRPNYCIGASSNIPVTFSNRTFAGY